MSNAKSRLVKDYLEWEKDEIDGIQAQPDDEDDMMTWSAIIFGYDIFPFLLPILVILFY